MDKQAEKLSKDKLNAARGVVKEHNLNQLTNQDDSPSKEEITAKERLDERARKAGC